MKFEFTEPQPPPPPPCDVVISMSKEEIDILTDMLETVELAPWGKLARQVVVTFMDIWRAQKRREAREE